MFKISIKDISYIIICSLANSMLSFGIVYIINNVVAGKSEFKNDYIGIVFVALIIYTYLLNICFQKWLNRKTYEILYKNEKIIFEKILKAPLLTLEKLGTQRFYTTIEDLRIFSSLPEIATQTFNSIIMLILCLIYLFVLSPISALVVVLMISALVFVYFFVIHKMSYVVNALRMHNEIYFKYLDDVIKGFKNIKLSLDKRENLLNKYLIPNRESAKKLDYKVNIVFLSINLINQYGLFLIIASILFVLPILNLLRREDVVTYVIIIMFISGPINNLISMQYVYTKLFVGKKRIKNFLRDFQVEIDYPEIDTPFKNKQFDFSNIIFEQVCFGYEENPDPHKNSFYLGPIDVNIKKGEVIFVVGGNGSGKSTFINVLTGLYKPIKGDIYLDDLKLNPTDITLQNLIAAVFTESHLFFNNYEKYSLLDNQKYQKLLEIMELDKIDIKDNVGSVRTAFSKGQNKRMALILALLEEKPILVLDEWAADQDPYFRKYFYEILVPQFKKEGKTIIAVTHDDMYFKYADRVVKFDYGQVKFDKTINTNTSLDKIWD